MGILDGTFKALGLANQSSGAEDFQSKLEEKYESGELDQWYREKEGESPKTRVQAYKTSQELDFYFNSLFRAVRDSEDKMPEFGSPERDYVLADFWRDEPILAGAVYSMSAKMTALRWTVTGTKDAASYHAKLLASAISMGPRYDWGDFISTTAQDFYSTNRGAFWETAREGSRLAGRLAGLAHLDSLQCRLTGSIKHPVIYQSNRTGQKIKFRMGEVIHFSSLKSAREEHVGHGFCAVDRAYRAAKLLIGLHKYDEEKLANLPPEGVAAVSGLTQEDFQDALALWRAARKKNDSLTFPQVLWLIGSLPNSKVALDFVGFSQMPESFDRNTVVEQYVNLLALAFGVDAREFWPISTSTLGTAAESEIQHMKAKGKGPGEFISITERQINGELPESAVFRFDTQDIAEDLQRATIAKAWIDALLPLTKAGQQMKSPGQQGGGFQAAQNGDQPQQPQAQAPEPTGEEFLTKEQFMRMLADHSVLPNWMVEDDRTVVFDSSVQEKSLWTSDPVVYKWDKGALSVHRLPIYSIRTGSPKAAPAATNGDSADNVPEAWLRKQQAEKSKIRGKPIPEDEAVRGASATVNAVLDELERWRKHPELAPYVPEDEESETIGEIVDAVKNQISD